MPILEKITQEDLYLYEIVKNPVLFAEFVSNYDKQETDEPFELTWYQKETIGDFNNYVCLCCARSVGKTESLALLITWAMVFRLFPDSYYTYHVPSRANLDPVFTKLVKLFRGNSFLKEFISQSTGVNNSEFKISLLNNSVLLCRIAGQTGTGISVVGLHTPFTIVDEAGYYNYNTFMELLPTVNTFTQGFKLMVSGVPTGLREKNVLYKCDQEDSMYSKHRVSAFQNPRFSDFDKERSIEQYGGEESEEYKHYVLGIHGMPVFALFDRGMFLMNSEPVYKLEISGAQYQNNLTEYLNRISIFPGLSSGKKDKCIIGIDLGYTEPTAIVILTTDVYNRLHFHGRIRLEKVSYNIQEKLIDFLDTKFEPSIIGIDKGSAGISVIQHMQQDRDYIHKNYEKRLIPIDFSSSVILGIDSDGNEIKNKTKPFAVSVLQDYTNNHKLMFSSTDLDMVTELERMTYSKTPSGEIVYRTLTSGGGKKGEDHFTSAVLCAILAYYLNNEFIQQKQERKKLFKVSWL